MVSKYLKALALTIILLIIGLSLIRYLDDSRVNEIASAIESASIDAEATQQLLFYESIFGDKEYTCPVLSNMIGSQIENIREVLGQIEQAEAQNFLGNTQLLRQKYLNQNIQLYLLVEKSIRDCGDESIEPIIYFYTDKSYSVDEATQSKVLDTVVEQCNKVRVFALPHDLDIPIVSVLLAKYKISIYPALIIGDEKFEGVYSDKFILGKLSC